jgi:hypothetical protein
MKNGRKAAQNLYYHNNMWCPDYGSAPVFFKTKKNEKRFKTLRTFREKLTVNCRERL